MMNLTEKMQTTVKCRDVVDPSLAKEACQSRFAK